MSSPSPEARPGTLAVPRKIFCGCYIVFAAGLGFCLSGPGQSYSIAEFISVYIAQFDLSRAAASTLFSIATMLSGSLTLLAGPQIDRIGYRLSCVGSTVLFALACLANSFAQGPVTLRS